MKKAANDYLPLPHCRPISINHMNQPTTNLPILPEDSAVCAAPLRLLGAPMTEVANPVPAPSDGGCSCCGITEVGGFSAGFEGNLRFQGC